MLEEGAITKVDHFSYTMQGADWVNVKWLYEIIIASLEKVGGPLMVTLLQCVVNVAIVFFLFRIGKLVVEKISNKYSTFFSTLGILLFLFIVENRMTGRPEMVSHFFTVFFLYTLLKNPVFQWKKMWVLILLQCLWANMHEGYPIGIVILGTYTIAHLLYYIKTKHTEDRKRLINAGLLLGSAIIAILLNPNTIKLWAQPFEIYRQVGANKYTTELYSFTEAQYWTLQAKVHTVLLVGVIIYWIIKIIQQRKERSIVFTPALITYLILIPLFGYLGLGANRNIPFAAIVIFPSIPLIFTDIITRLNLNTTGFYNVFAKRTLFISSVLAFIFYVLVVSDRYYHYVDSKDSYGMHISMMDNPIGAAKFIKDNKIKGPAFADYFISSYLLWDLYPDFKSFIDLRDLDIFPETFFENYFDLYSNPAKFKELDSIYQFNYIVVSTSQLRYLQQDLYWGEGFNLVYTGPVSAIFLRFTDENEEINWDLSTKKLFWWPESPEDPAYATMLTKLLNPNASYTREDEENMPIYSGMYYSAMKNYPLAIKELGAYTYAGSLSENSKANSSMGHTYLEYGTLTDDNTLKTRRLDSAQIFFLKAIEVNPKEKSAYLGLASLALTRNNYTKSEEYLAEYLKLDKTNDYAYFLKGLCARALWKQLGDEQQKDKVEQYMSKSYELNDDNLKTQLYLAEIAIADNNKDAARVYLNKALQGKMPWLNYEEDMIKEIKLQTGVQ